MIKNINQIEHSCKGKLIGFQDNIVEVLNEKNEVTDTVDINEFLENMIKFCNDNREENVEIKLIAKATL